MEPGYIELTKRYNKKYKKNISNEDFVTIFKTAMLEKILIDCIIDQKPPDFNFETLKECFKPANIREFIDIFLERKCLKPGFTREECIDKHFEAVKMQKLTIAHIKGGSKKVQDVLRLTKEE